MRVDYLPPSALLVCTKNIVDFAISECMLTFICIAIVILNNVRPRARAFIIFKFVYFNTSIVGFDNSNFFLVKII